MTSSSSSGGGGLLPSYQRIVTGYVTPGQLFGRRSFRARERYLMLMVVVSLGLVGFGALFFLPEDFRAPEGVYRVYQQVQRAGPELLMPGPPRADLQHLYAHGPRPRQPPAPADIGPEEFYEDVHVIEDKQKLQAKIDEAYQSQKVLEKPELAVAPVQPAAAEPSQPLNVPSVDQSSVTKGQRQYSDRHETIPPAVASRYPRTRGGEDLQPETQRRRDKVKERQLTAPARGGPCQDSCQPEQRARPRETARGSEGQRVSGSRTTGGSRQAAVTTKLLPERAIGWPEHRGSEPEMRLMQRLAITGLLSLMLLVLLTGSLVSRREQLLIEPAGADDHQPNNPAWLQENLLAKAPRRPAALVVNVRQRRPEDLDDRDQQPEQLVLEVDAAQAVPEPEAAADSHEDPGLEVRLAPGPGLYVPRAPQPALDDETSQRREKIKEMMKHGWDNYVRYAWGKNELRPISKRGHSASIFGNSNMGATIVDSLDTLYIMGLHDEFQQARDWIAQNLDFDINSEISLFETNIRFMGSLLSAFALTGDTMFRDKAAELGERMLPAFNTDTGIPHSLVNLHSGASKNYGWASSGCSILSEIGTMHLEFAYLSDITGNPVYLEKVKNVRQKLREAEKPQGLYPNYIHPKTGKWGRHHMSLGGLGDSFYEYLLKAWIQSGKEDGEAREMYDEAMDAVMKHMIRTSHGGLVYASDLQYQRLEHKMGHLACFAGGMFALGAKTLESDASPKYMEVAAGLTNTCHESYDRSATKLGPEAFHFIEGNEARSLKIGEKYYILRPETFESYFVMWRLTKDPKYREWGWEAVQALERHCRVPGGYTGLHNVYQLDSPKDDVQQSYFFAETLKYLYLLFSDDDLINLDDWVFNSEAHVLPIRGNPFYRPAASSLAGPAAAGAAST